MILVGCGHHGGGRGRSGRLGKEQQHPLLKTTKEEGEGMGSRGFRGGQPSRCRVRFWGFDDGHVYCMSSVYVDGCKRKSAGLALSSSL